MGNIERLTLTGSANINGTGNHLGNVLEGNSGNNILAGGDGADTISGNGGTEKIRGGLGNDTLDGGLGIDYFVFDTALNGSLNRDTITNFNANNDTFQLDNPIFTQLGGNGALDARYFRAGATALDSNDFIVYNKATGALFYDSNGNGAGGAIQFATLDNEPTLTASDFIVI